MNKYLSVKIKILSLLAILFVLYIHSGFHANEIENMFWIDAVQNFISSKLGRCAVPLFFMISGYLFFLNVPDGFISIKEKIRKRFKTLFIPYICAALFFVLFGCLIEILPGSSKYMNGTFLPLFNKSISEIFCAVFYATKIGNAPFAFQLWFLRDLIIIILCSPLLYFFYSKSKGMLLLVLFALSYLQTPYFPCNGVFWFMFGAFLCGENLLAKKNLIKSPFCLFIAFSFIVISVLQVFYQNAIYIYFNKLIIIWGLISIWALYDYIFIDLNNKILLFLLKICPYTFFIYLYHEPTLNIVRKLIVAIIGKTEIGYTISYLLSPFVFIMLAVCVGAFFRKYISNAYNIMTGGR